MIQYSTIIRFYIDTQVKIEQKININNILNK